MIRIVGITGTNGAGKGTAVNFLVRKMGFKHYSVRDFLIDEINRRGLIVNRDTMNFVANDLRKKYYPSYIVETLYKKAKAEGGNSVIESIRTTGEVESLRSKGDFILISIDAPVEERYKRIILRDSETDRISFEEFIENEKKEMISDDPAEQNLFKCMELSDYKLYNDGSIEDLEKKIADIFNCLR